MAEEYRKISVIGAGAVGSSVAFSLIQSNQVDEVALVDVAVEKVAGEVMDLSDAAAFSGGTKVVGGKDYALCKDSDIIIITAGAAQKVGETRLNLVKKNTAIMTSIVSEIIKHNTTALLIIVSNPVDILTTVAMTVSGFPSERVIGTGTFLDTGRAREAIASKLGLTTNQVEAYVLGEHGDSQFIPWSLVQVEENHAGLNNLTQKEKTEIENATINKAYEIINRKGATHYGIASAIELLITHIYEEDDEPLPVSTYQEADADNGFHITCSLVCLTRDGVQKSAIPQLEPLENKKLEKSVAQLKDVLKTLDI